VLEIPAERANALDDNDLAWLSSEGKAPEAPPSEPLFEKPEVTEKKVAAFERKASAQRRRSGLVLAAGSTVAVAAAAAAILFVLGRMGGGGPFAPRAREESQAAPAGSAFDASGLVARQAPEAPPAALAAPSPSPVVPKRSTRITRDDRQLLDLLAKKDDAAVVAPQGDAVESAASALDAEAVERTVSANRKAFDACVSRALRLNPTLRIARRATLVVTVQPSGAVTGAFIAEEEVDRTDLGVCLSAAARRMVFPGFEGEPIDVSMPLSLSAVF
jgi:hypothetical protein